MNHALKEKIFLAVSILWLLSAQAAPFCDVYARKMAGGAQIYDITFSKDPSTPAQDVVAVNGIPVLTGKVLRGVAEDRSGQRLVYQSSKGSSDPEDFGNLYLIDLQYTPPKVFSFGVKAAKNEFHWASWSAKRSVIALKYNVKFVYDGVRVTPPAADNDLWSAIRPTMFDTPVERLVPFAREVPLPPPSVAPPCLLNGK